MLSRKFTAKVEEGLPAGAPVFVVAIEEADGLGADQCIIIDFPPDTPRATADAVRDYLNKHVYGFRIRQ